MKQTQTPLTIILTDTHLSQDNIEVVQNCFRETIDKALELKLKYITHLGDIFQSRKGQTQDVLDAFTTILDEIEAAGLVMRLIPGNHDKQDYNSVISYLTPYRTHPALDLYETPTFVGDEEFEYFYLPFYTDSLYLELFPKRPKKKGVKRIAFTHIGMNGAVMNNGMKIESGINGELFKDFDLVLIGHYHDPQRYSDTIHYIGASLQHNFGEKSRKGAMILYDDLSIELLPLSFPQYINFEVNVKDITIKDIADLKKEVQESGNFLRVTLLGSEKDVKSFDSDKLKAIGVDVKRKEDVIEVEVIESRVSAFTDQSLVTAFETFCTTNKLNHNKGLKYLSKALNIPYQEIQTED